MIARVNIGVADVRAEPKSRSERVSQGLFNEIVEIIGEAPSFSQVRFADKYEGWMGRQFLTPYKEFSSEGPLIVQAGIATVYNNPDMASRKTCYIPYGCRLYGRMIRDFLEMQTERWGNVYIQQLDLIDESNTAPLSGAESDDIVIEAEKFLGVPYLWGGRSFFGLDCSGFVKLIYSRFACELPRDTKDQIKTGIETPRNEIRRGDLLFFPRHVALAISDTLFIHSSRSNGGVAYNSLNPDDKGYREDLDKSFKMARRIFD